MFRTTLHVAHMDRKFWRLTKPLVYEGDWEYIIIKPGFITDFASIPKPVRWLLDNAGRNSEAAVLHDALWRESMRGDESRIDPWYVDGLFRRALYQTGSIALSRGLMWFAVRAAATASGRLGKLGPNLFTKVLRLAFVFGLGLLTAAVPTIIATIGLGIYWLASWIVAGAWYLAYERRQPNMPTRWPWPVGRSSTLPHTHNEAELLVIIQKAPSPDETHDTPDVIDLAAADRLRKALAGSHDLSAGELEQVLGV